MLGAKTKTGDNVWISYYLYQGRAARPNYYTHPTSYKQSDRTYEEDMEPATRCVGADIKELHWKALMLQEWKNHFGDVRDLGYYKTHKFTPGEQDDNPAAHEPQPSSKKRHQNDDGARPSKKATRKAIAEQQDIDLMQLLRVSRRWNEGLAISDNEWPTVQCIVRTEQNLRHNPPISVCRQMGKHRKEMGSSVYNAPEYFKWLERHLDEEGTTSDAGTSAMTRQGDQKTLLSTTPARSLTANRRSVSNEQIFADATVLESTMDHSVARARANAARVKALREAQAVDAGSSEDQTS